MRIFKANPDRMEHYHQRRRWIRRLNRIMLGMAFTAVLAVAVKAITGTSGKIFLSSFRLR